MARINQSVRIPTIRTHEGGPAKVINAEQMLRRSIMACMLWEDTFYEDGVSVAERIKDLVGRVGEDKVADMAREARTAMKLRHLPLLLARYLAKRKYPVAALLPDIIQRPDELTEFLAIYWKDGKEPLSAQVKKGLAAAFTKFDEYALAKYNRDEKIKLRDVLFLCHAKPVDEVQAGVWKRLIDGQLQVPDTWEVALSAGKDKRETWVRLIEEKKLGALALLRNLRNMQSAGVPDATIRTALTNARVDRVLPFRFLAAARYAPMLKDALEAAMFRCLKGAEKIPGRTVVMVDVSGSMRDTISAKSEMTRMDAAYGLAILAREMCEGVCVATFSNQLALIAPRRGFALRDAMHSSQEHGGTYLGQAINALHTSTVMPYDRIIVITDEQAHDRLPDPKGKGYVINVGSYKNGIGYGAWTHIDGWSEAVLQYIRQSEQ
jgi:60 kDa SS-A/Ro ribonucleoprotein